MSEARDHTGRRIGAVTVLECLPERDISGRRIYRVRWECCGTETIEKQVTLTKLVKEKRHQCRECYIGNVKPVPTIIQGISIQHPQWGLVFEITGPMGSRFGGGNVHTHRQPSSE